MLEWLYRKGWLPQGKVITTPEGNKYLERFWLMHWRWGVFLHRMSQGDYDLDLHDHPYAWSFAIILSGGYQEAYAGRYGRRLWRIVRWFNWIPARKFHTIMHLTKYPTWTLFVHGPRVKPWGFMRNCDSNGFYLQFYNSKLHDGRIDSAVTIPESKL